MSKGRLQTTHSRKPCVAMGLSCWTSGLCCSTLMLHTVFLLACLLESNAQAVKHVQSNPDEVCPAGWHPGDKTMKPTPKVRDHKASQAPAQGWNLVSLCCSPHACIACCAHTVKGIIRACACKHAKHMRMDLQHEQVGGIVTLMRLTMPCAGCVCDLFG